MIKWDKPCYKCLSHFCDLSCKEPEHLKLPQRTEQEPVAWIEKDMQCDDFYPYSVTCEKPTIVVDGYEWLPLYTHPPQRTWVGLTDGEAHRILEDKMTDWMQKWCAIEIKLKEKNT
jgi:hypothetical protein